MSKKKNRQSIRSRKMLGDAFIELLQEKPLQKISISEITDRADLARSTFYTHFETKDELLENIIDELLGQFFVMIAARDHSVSNVERDIEINISFFRIWKECCNLDEVIKVVDIDNIILSRFQEYWRQNSRETSSEFGQNISPSMSKYLQNYLAYSFYGILKVWLMNGKKHPPEVMGRMLYELTGPPVLRNIIAKFNDEVI